MPCRRRCRRCLEAGVNFLRSSELAQTSVQTGRSERASGPLCGVPRRSLKTQRLRGVWCTRAWAPWNPSWWQGPGFLALVNGKESFPPKLVMKRASDRVRGAPCVYF